ncbi:serine hydrolase domain-containing protein [Streptomyces yaizuensis]|uniref:Serine hydrolase n=1 Tax=Streptomyces yaizuensis TaxID=2989713 RepID=A0ABQ5NRM0_9ACTN|nr:serine hydrolase domain-containing protein [Streptomyces sp. YSPA8]GLF92917.1 serine hydrolase [Streptomyces sp. YSPA8]
MTQIPKSAPDTRRRRSGSARRAVALGVVAAATATAALAAPALATGTEPESRKAGFGRAELQRGLDDIVRADGVVGVQATLVQGAGRTYARSGTAERGTDRPMPHQGSFRMGSNTKTFVATVVLQLVAEGRMGLDDSVEHHLPGVVGGNGHDGRKITVRQLLQHTSGLPDYDGHLPGVVDEEKFQQHRYDTYRPAQLVALGLSEKPLFAPGEGFSYSNTGYILTGMIIKKVTGQHWSQEVRERIIEPLGLKHTFSPGARTGLPGPHSKAYQQFKPGGALIDSTEVNMSWGDSAGDLVTTSNDLARFWQGLLGGKLLGKRQLAQMRTTVPAPDESLPMTERSGLGIFWRELSCGGGYWGHGGSTLGHLNANGFTGKGGRGAIVMRNSNLAFADRDIRADKLVDAALCDGR